MPQSLDYQSSRPAAASQGFSPPRAAVGAALAAEFVSAVLLFVFFGGGPIFPFTVVYAPVAIVAELYPGDRAHVAFLLLAGPLLLSAYGYLAVRWARPAVWIGLACFHLGCFVVVCRLRAVIWPW